MLRSSGSLELATRPRGAPWVALPFGSARRRQDAVAVGEGHDDNRAQVAGLVGGACRHTDAVAGPFLQVGLPRLAGNRENMPELPGWAGRAERAHFNMLKNLVLFAILVLAAQVAGRPNPTTAMGAQLL